MARHLDASGFEAEVAGSVEAALRFLEDRKPDIIVTDIFLGDGDRLGLIQTVRNAHPDLIAAAPASGSRVSIRRSGIQAREIFAESPLRSCMWFQRSVSASQR
jgi:DNA-binding response OmpR family regulator